MKTLTIQFLKPHPCRGTCGRLSFEDFFDEGEIVPDHHGPSDGCEVTAMSDGTFRVTHPSVRGYEIKDIPADVVRVLADEDTRPATRSEPTSPNCGG